MTFEEYQTACDALMEASKASYGAWQLLSNVLGPGDTITMQAKLTWQNNIITHRLLEQMYPALAGQYVPANRREEFLKTGKIGIKTS